MAQNTPFGDLTPLLAPRSVAVVGASDREGNLGGAAVRFLQKFGFSGPVWPVNASRPTVDGLTCFPSLAELPGVPDLAIVAVPADAVTGVVEQCIERGVPSAVAWAGGFAEVGPAGRMLQARLEALCDGSAIRFCGPNCIGVLNTSIGLTASFSSMLLEHDVLTPGAVSMVSQSGGIGAMAHSRAQQMGLGFRVMVSVGNEACLSIADFVRALVHDDGTRVIAVYVEGLADPEGFVDALALAREHGKPVVVLKGGASVASGRAALAHTGRLAGLDRTYDAIFREHAVIRVGSTDELLDVSLQLASMRPEQLPRGERVLISSFGGGSGVVCTDQCVREGLVVPATDDATRERVGALLSPLASTLNPIDLTPGTMTQAGLRERLPAALRELGAAPGFDAWLFMAAGFGALAPELVEMVDRVRSASDKPLFLTWQSMPVGTAEALAARGIPVFGEHGRAARALGHIVRHAADTRHRIRRLDAAPPPFPWHEHVDAEAGAQVVSEHVVSRILEGADLPVARGRFASDADAAVAAAKEVGYPVAIKGLSAAVTHRAAVGLVALDIDGEPHVRETEQRLRQRAAELGVALDGVWVQHMHGGRRELLITAFRDAEFGVMVGIGLGGGLTEVIDDVVFARAPLDAAGALDLLEQLRTVRRMPEFLGDAQRRSAAAFAARFSMLAASAPWPRFTLEVNPLRLSDDDAAAVDGLLLIE